MRSHDLAIDRPDEGRQLAGDRRGDDGRPLALPGERPKAPAQPHLRFPGNLAHRPRCGRHLYLLLAANTWRMPIAPSGFDQDTPRPTIAGLGDAAAVDRIACGAFGGYETEIPHQLAGVLKARQIADLGQHRHCRNASCRSSGTQTAVSSPARNSLARPTASRRFVFTRSPGFFGISEGAATMQSWPSFLISR